MSVSTYAKIAQQAYRNPPALEIGDYHLLPYRSNNRVKVYTNGLRGELVFSIRGTFITDVNDFTANLHIFNNTLAASQMFTEVKFMLDQFLSEKIIRDIIIVGHSLGGSLAIELLKAYPDRITGVYAFNPGYGYKQFIDDAGKRLKCLVNNSKECIELKLVQKKLHVYITGWDPISTLARVNQNTYNIKPTEEYNPHTIRNFLDPAVVGSGSEDNQITLVPATRLLADIKAAA